jgi:hypothetical protein
VNEECGGVNPPAPLDRAPTVPAAKPKRPRGRPAGVPNRLTVAAREIMQRVDFDPLEGLLRVAKSRRYSMDLRLKAMLGALPVLYPRLSTVFLNARQEKDVNINIVQEMAADPELCAAMEKLSLAASEAAARQLPSPRVIDVTPEQSNEA